MNEKSLDPNYHWYRVELLCSDTLRLKRYYFRGATPREIAAAFHQENVLEQEVYLLRRCVANEEDWEGSVLVGVARALFELIKVYSGLVDGNVPAALTGEADETDPMISLLEGVAVAMLAGVDRAKLRNADIRDYWWYLMQGKRMFEGLYGQPVEGLLHGKNLFRGKLGNGAQPVPNNVKLPASGHPNSLGFIHEGGYSYGPGG